MVDGETHSLWSQLLGEAMSGPLTGTTLKQIPSVITDWNTWVERHPDTTAIVMSRTTTEYVRDLQRSTDDGPSPPGPLAIGLSEGGFSQSWSFESLFEEPVVNDHLQKRPVLVVYDDQSGTAAVFDRTVDDRVLSFFLKDGKLVDRETGSEWDRITGKALSGPLQSARLKLLPGTVSDSFTWDLFHP